jgi:hypothetical protein
MIECQVRALFTEIASSEPGYSQVDTQLAHRRGRARLRWHRACVAGAPVLAGATVAAVALAVSAAGPSRPGPSPVAAGPTAPRQFSVFDPYLSFGWLPAGVSALEGGTSRQQVWLTAGHKLDSPMTWSIAIHAAGQCHLTNPAPAGSQTPGASAPAARPTGTAGTGAMLKCRGPQGTPETITGRAPAVDGHRAYWAGPLLAWQYARNGWAEMNVPWMRGGSPGQPGYLQPANRREAIKIASQVRYGAVTPPLLFPFQLTHLPSRWQVSSLTYVPQAGVLRASELALGAGPPNLGADGGLVYETGLPYFLFEPATRRTETCGRGTTEIINGYRAVVSHMTESNLANTHTLVRQSLCAGKADGLSLYISEFGAHPAISTADLFGHHMRLLGRHPAGWTKQPIG